MDRAKLAAAVAEAERFIARAKALPEPHDYQSGGHTFTNDNFPREQGAIKRASMDLTRALADLRRPA
jgi:UDP-N-acetylenolpyruvoylglucosamine reductase